MRPLVPVLLSAALFAALPPPLGPLAPIGRAVPSAAAADPAAAPASPTTGAAAAPSTPSATAPAPAAAPVVTPTSVEVRTAAGLVVRADLREEYLTGSPILATITVSNPGEAPVAFPDLTSRPWLVRFQLDAAGRKTERYTTPPATDPGKTWTIPARGQRRVLLEMPSSSGFSPGDGTLAVTIADPAGAVVLGPRPVKIAAPKPVGGAVVHEPTIASAVGAQLPWLHQGAGGFDLYLVQFDKKAPTRALGQYFLARLPSKVEPILSRSRPSDATSRYLYWKSGATTFGYARLEGSALAGAPRTVAIAYPNAEPLGRGATDANGGLVVPLWIPAPKGAAGSVQALCIDERGSTVLRKVADLPARPEVVATAVDAGSNLLVALGHAAALDLYKVDPSLPPELPARGTRVTKLEGGARVAAAGFDTIPDQPSGPGGLSLVSVVARTGADGAVMARTRWSDLSGKAVVEGPEAPWRAPGTVSGLLTSGLGATYLLSRDSSGANWYTPGGGAPVKVPESGGVLWANDQSVYLRRLGGGGVWTDRELGPRAP
jgi:hypothetical protein